MRLKSVTISALLLATLLASGAALASTGNVNLLLGQKNLEKGDWEPLENQRELGLMVDFRPEDWKINFAVDLLRSSDSARPGGVEVNGSTSELDLGVRKIWEDLGVLKPFVGGGVGLMTAKAEMKEDNVKVNDDDSVMGFWMDAGFYARVSERFNVGVEARYSFAKAELFGQEIQAGGTHIGFLLGYHW